MSAQHTVSLNHEQADLLLDALGFAQEVDPDNDERYGDIAEYLLGTFDRDHMAARPEAPRYYVRQVGSLPGAHYLVIDRETQDPLRDGVSNEPLRFSTRDAAEAYARVFSEEPS